MLPRIVTSNNGMGSRHGMGSDSIFAWRDISVRENGEWQNFGSFIWPIWPCFLFGNSPTLRGLCLFLFGLEWPSYGYVVPQNMPYYLCIRTYLHVYVRTLVYCLCARTYLIYTYLYSYTTYMYEFIYIRTYTYYIPIYVVIIFDHVCVPICTYVYPLVTPY